MTLGLSTWQNVAPATERTPCGAAPVLDMAPGLAAWALPQALCSAGTEHEVVIQAFFEQEGATEPLDTHGQGLRPQPLFSEIH